MGSFEDWFDVHRENLRLAERVRALALESLFAALHQTLDAERDLTRRLLEDIRAVGGVPLLFEDGQIASFLRGHRDGLRDLVCKKEEENARLKEAQKDARSYADFLLAVARGCRDYAGGYRGPEDEGRLDAYRHGIETVCRAVAAAVENGLVDPQVRALHEIGRA